MKRALVAMGIAAGVLILCTFGTLWVMDHCQDVAGMARNAAQEREAALEELHEAERLLFPVRWTMILVVLR